MTKLEHHGKAVDAKLTDLDHRTSLTQIRAAALAGIVLPLAGKKAPVAQVEAAKHPSTLLTGCKGKSGKVADKCNKLARHKALAASR